jgi:Cu2+-exporting ATPase
MKTGKFLLLFLLAFCLTTTANAQTKKAKVKTTQQGSTAYACPMKCEGDKRYSKAGDCPVCGMHLTAVTKKKKREKRNHTNNLLEPSNRFKK